MELGVLSFADTAPDPATGKPQPPGERLRDLLEEIELADQVGLDVFGVGEHHRPDFAASAPTVILGAAAVRTKRIRLSSAVTVLSSDDPVRVFQQFATVDLLSGGRAEVMAGRGSFTESFPLFGYDLADYDSLFIEKLKLLLAIRDDEHVTWAGRHRAPIDGLGVYPRPIQDPLPVWVAVGGSANSVARAGTLGLPLALAIIGGAPARFAPLIDLYREAAELAGHDPATLQVAVNTHGYIADGSRQAADEFWPYYAQVMTKIGQERGWPPMTRDQYEALRSPAGALAVGSVDEMIEKVLSWHEIFQNDRYLAHFDIGSVPHAGVMRSIELFGTKVAPAVRKALGSSESGVRSAEQAG